jgi:pimeloyl-ACP methyl ester carboxylesterase
MGNKYVRASDGVSIAYQLMSDAGPTLLYVPGAISNLTLEDTTPDLARFYEQLSRFARLVRFDKRGTGLSDPIYGVTTLEQQVEDIEAILDATQSERVTLCGLSHGGSLAAWFALSRPERVERLIIVDAFCSSARDPDDPSTEGYVQEAYLDRIEGDFEAFTGWVADGAVGDSNPSTIEATAAFVRASGSPAIWTSVCRGLLGLDLRPRLQEIQIPALVIHAAGDRLIPVSHGRCLAKGIAGARYLELDTRAHIPWLDPSVAPQVMAAIEDFTTGQVRFTAGRTVANVLFTDIVDSTTRQRAVGDAEWRGLRERFEAGTSRRVEQFGGRVVQFTGDGVMAAFPSPGEALRAARVLVGDARDLGLEVRAGLHAGEAYEVEGQLFGSCVHVAARVMARAAPGQVLTTDVVRGLVEGSGFDFEDCGEAELKGVGRRRLIGLC